MIKRNKSSKQKDNQSHNYFKIKNIKVMNISLLTTYNKIKE